MVIWKKNKRPNQNYHQNRNTSKYPIIPGTRNKHSREPTYRNNDTSRYLDTNTKTKWRPRYTQPASTRFQTSEQQLKIGQRPRTFFNRTFSEVVRPTPSESQRLHEEAQIERPPQYNNQRQNYFLPQPYGPNRPPPTPMMRYHNHQHYPHNQSLYKPSIRRL